MPQTLPRPSHTKIVATVGPACAEVGQLVDLIRAGVDVFRVNTAHGTREQQQQCLDRIREAGGKAGAVVGILVDLAGPKIRLGELPQGAFECVVGNEVRFVRGEQETQPGVFTTTYDRLVDELEVDDRVLLADGTVTLTVKQVDARSVVCKVVQGGTLRSRQGVNLPGVQLSAPALGEADRERARWAARAGVDFISLSFVRSPDDVRQLRAIVEAEGCTSQLVAKIEKPEALEQLDEIVQAADAVMVARGDLGVEIDIATVAVVQKQIVACCRKYVRPVIIATQMLDSMQRSRLPTRAEVTDVANAVLDGADACMLSGETAIGKYPREAVEMMHRIALATESLSRPRLSDAAPQLDRSGINRITEGTTFAAGMLAEWLQASMIVVVSQSGKTARGLSQHRRLVPTIGVSDSEATLRRMCLYWGVIPVPGIPTQENAHMVKHLIELGRTAGHLSQGDRLVIIGGTGLKGSRHNMITVQEVE